MSSQLHHETRKIYQAQHQRISGDHDAFQRNLSMYDAEHFGIAQEWFADKLALDVGCGNIGALMVRLIGFGAKCVSGIDVGEDWIPLLRKNFERLGIPEDRYNLSPGSAVEIPFPDEQFDFVSVNGVLIHLKNVEEIEVAFAEAVRVTKKGGYLYTSWGPCGGVMQGVIFPALRQHYRVNPTFKEFIDGLTPALIHQTIDQMCEISRAHGGEDLNGEFLKSLFGEDFCMFLHNFIQAPTWYSNECTPEYIENLYRSCGMVNIRRLHRFVIRRDIRKYFAPLHYARELEVSKILYGEGVPIYVAEKS